MSAKVILNGERSHPFPSAKTLKPEWKRFESEGFLFFSLRRSEFELGGELRVFLVSGILEAYGSTFVSPAYVERVWTEFFDLRTLHEAPDSCKTSWCCKSDRLKRSGPLLRAMPTLRRHGIDKGGTESDGPGAV